MNKFIKFFLDNYFFYVLLNNATCLNITIMNNTIVYLRDNHCIFKLFFVFIIWKKFKGLMEWLFMVILEQFQIFYSLRTISMVWRILKYRKMFNLKEQLAFIAVEHNFFFLIFFLDGIKSKKVKNKSIIQPYFRLKVSLLDFEGIDTIFRNFSILENFIFGKI